MKTKLKKQNKIKTDKFYGNGNKWRDKQVLRLVVSHSPAHNRILYVALSNIKGFEYLDL